MTRLLYIAGGVVAGLLAAAALAGLGWWISKTFGLWGLVAMLGLGVAIQGGLFGLLLFQRARR